MKGEERRPPGRLGKCRMGAAGGQPARGLSGPAGTPEHPARPVAGARRGGTQGAGVFAS